MKELFPCQTPVYNPQLPDGELHYYPNFLNEVEADFYFKKLLEETLGRRIKSQYLVRPTTNLVSLRFMQLIQPLTATQISL